MFRNFRRTKFESHFLARPKFRYIFYTIVTANKIKQYIFYFFTKQAHTSSCFYWLKLFFNSRYLEITLALAVFASLHARTCPCLIPFKRCEYWNVGAMANGYAARQLEENDNLILICTADIDKKKLTYMNRNFTISIKNLREVCTTAYFVSNHNYSMVFRVDFGL